MRILGIDYGERRTGVAISDESEFLSSTLTTVTGSDPYTVAQKIAELASEHGAGRIVLGLPRNMDGSEGFRAVSTRGFGDRLSALLPGTEIVYYDERMTTVSASGYMREAGLSAKKQKGSIDMLAAKIILQDYLDSKR